MEGRPLKLFDRFRRRRAAPAPAVLAVPPRPDYGVKVLSPDGLQTATIPRTWPATLRLYDGLRGTYGAIYRMQHNVASVIDRMAKDVGAIKLKTYGKLPGSTPLEPTSRIELDESDLQKLFDRPGGGVAPSRWRRALASDILIYDEAFIVKVRQGGRVAGLVRVPVPALIPDRDPLTALITGYFIAGRPGLRIPVDDVVRFPGYDPESSTGAVSSMEKLRRILSEEQAAGDWREKFYRNSARREGLVERPLEAPPFTDELREAWRSDFETTLSGADGSGRVGLLEDGMTFKESSWSPRDAEYAKARQLSRVEVAAFFGMPLSIAGATDSQPTKDERTSYLTDTIVPLLTRIEDELDIQLVPEFDPFEAERMYVQFNVDAKLRGSFEETAAIASTAVGGPVATVNEWRARINLPPLEGGDEIFVPLNSVRGGGPEASPQSPVETPATGIEPAGTTPGGGTAPVKSMAIAALIDAKAITSDELRALADLPKARKAKVVPRTVLQRRDKAAKQFTELFRKTFERQARAVNRLIPPGAKSLSSELVEFDSARWNRELAADMVALSIDVVDSTAKRAARQIRGTYDADRTRAYIAERSRIAAESINRQTAEAVNDALADESGAELKKVFELAKGARADQLGLSLGNSSIAFARTETAHQNGAKKTWVVTSGNSRHPEMDGETVGADDPFSNGLQYPGDPTGDAAETAGCECLLNLQAAAPAAGGTS